MCVHRAPDSKTTRCQQSQTPSTPPSRPAIPRIALNGMFYHSSPPSLSLSLSLSHHVRNVLICRATPLECVSNIACEVVSVTLDNGTSIFQCREIGFVSPTVQSPSQERNGEIIQADSALMWHIVSGVLLVALVVTIIIFIINCLRGKPVARRRQGRGRVNTASTNMTSVTTDSSVENSLRRQDSQEHSCSSQEGLPAVPPESLPAGHKCSAVPSIATFGSYVTAVDNGVTTVVGGRGFISVWEDKDGGRGNDEGEGLKDKSSFPSKGNCFDNDQKASGSFPSSLGTTGPPDMFSKLGESPDPSKAGGIWF